MENKEEVLSVQQLIRGIVNKLAGSRLSKEEFEDAVQDINVRLLLKHYDVTRAKYTTFAQMVATQAVQEMFRPRGKNLVKWKTLAKGSAEEVTQGMFSSPEELSDDALREEAFQAACSRLSPEEKEIVSYIVKGNLTGYARMKGIKKHTAWQRRVRALRKISRLLKKEISSAE